MKRLTLMLLAVFFCLFSLSAPALSAFAAQTANKNASDSSAPEISAPCAILMDADTGTVLYEKNSREKRPLASITKVMTLLLTFEALQNHTISLNDTVTVSEHAAGMGGSQVFLEPGETQTVDTMIKCITVASANDACVSMAELLGGSEDSFVKKMNQKAKELGMKDTNFVNSCGLDADGHYSSALDIARMSQALTTRFPQIFDYTKIWMEDITHHTARGEKTFTLSNTNRLLKQYPDATGLKTGSTGKAKFCLSATATRNHVNLIAVVLAAPDNKQRIADVKKLLDWGFSNCKLYTDKNTDILPRIPVTGGSETFSQPVYASDFRYLSTSGTSDQLRKQIQLPKKLTAPVRKGDILGHAVYYLGENKIGEISLIAERNIARLTYPSALSRLLNRLLFSKQTI